MAMLISNKNNFYIGIAADFTYFKIFFRCHRPVIFMSNTFIYICIPTYDCASLFKKLLYSIIMQQYRDTEFLLTNNPDDSIVAVVNAIISRDKLFTQDWQTSTVQSESYLNS
jgi:hypothetical protein